MYILSMGRFSCLRSKKEGIKKPWTVSRVVYFFIVHHYRHWITGHFDKANIQISMNQAS